MLVVEARQQYPIITWAPFRGRRYLYCCRMHCVKLLFYENVTLHAVRYRCCCFACLSLYSELSTIIVWARLYHLTPTKNNSEIHKPFCIQHAPTTHLALAAKIASSNLGRCAATFSKCSSRRSPRDAFRKLRVSLGRFLLQFVCSTRLCASAGVAQSLERAEYHISATSLPLRMYTRF